MTFSEDNFHRIMTNLNVFSRCLILKNHQITEEERDRLYEALQETQGIVYMLEANFSERFKHNPQVRRVCPNENCHGYYAYFYEDFLFCPHCGTKLRTTRDDRGKEHHEDCEVYKVKGEIGMCSGNDDNDKELYEMRCNFCPLYKRYLDANEKKST